VAAAGFADVLAGDAHPLVIGRSGQHPLEQLAVAGLQLGLRVQRPARLGDALGERVAHALELGEVGDTGGAPRSRYGGIDREARKGLRREGHQLLLDAPDLAAQLGPRKALVAPNSKRGKRVSFEQIRHKTRDECRSRRRHQRQ